MDVCCLVRTYVILALYVFWTSSPFAVRYTQYTHNTVIFCVCERLASGHRPFASTSYKSATFFSRALFFSMCVLVPVLLLLLLAVQINFNNFFFVLYIFIKCMLPRVSQRASDLSHNRAHIHISHFAGRIIFFSHFIHRFSLRNPFALRILRKRERDADADKSQQLSKRSRCERARASNTGAAQLS